MIQWTELEQEYNQLNEKVLASGLDQRERATVQKRLSQLAELFALHEQQQGLEQEIIECEQSIASETGELKELFEAELVDLHNQLQAVTNAIEDKLFPADERDERSVFLEIRAGAGGQEAALFAADLFRMYSNFALSKGWSVEIVDSNTTDIGGYKELTAHIKGKNVYKYLKFESGVHRVQRVPQTETQGRVHTSTVTVAVLPEAEEVDIQINPQDLRIDVFRAQGAGGQHVNTTDSAVRIVHIPTGVTVSCQDERSQLKNKNKAMKVLRSRLYQAEQERQDAERSAARKEQVGTGERSEKIRTYNFPQNRITDHRVDGLTLKKLDRVLEGDIKDLLEPLIDWDRKQRKAQQ